MALLDQRPEEPTAAQAAIAVHRFVENCIEWARKRELPKHTDAMQESPNVQHAMDALQWATFAEFMEHARRELEAGTLDHWFTGSESR